MSAIILPDSSTDWRRPVAAVGEETYWTHHVEGEEHSEAVIRWHLSEEGMARVRRMEACWDCLTPFPAPPTKVNWHIWKASGFNWHPLFGISGSRKLVCAGRCPICRSEISAEMLAIQMDDEWTKEDAQLKRAAADNLAADREREEHEDRARAQRLGLIDPVAPPSRRKSAKRRGES